MRGYTRMGYGPDSTYPDQVIYLEPDDVLFQVDGGCVAGDGMRCPVVQYREMDGGGVEVTPCPVHFQGGVLDLPDWDATD